MPASIDEKMSSFGIWEIWEAGLPGVVLKGG